MINYYKILNLENFYNESLIEPYKNSLKKYKNLPFYSKKVKDEIKEIKEAYYVLSTDKLKIIYDQKLRKSIKIKKDLNIDRDILRNNYNKTIYSRNFENHHKSVINLEKELELKKSKLNVNKKNSNYINE